MKDANNIEDIFKDKLHDLESPVRADLWTNIAAQAGVQTTFWTVSKIAGLGAAAVVISAALWFGLSSSDQEIAKQEPTVDLVENVMQEDSVIESSGDYEQQESTVEVVAEKVAQNKTSKQNTKSPESPINSPQPVTMTQDEWNDFLRVRDASFADKTSESSVNKSQTAAEKIPEPLPVKELVAEKPIIKSTDKVDTKAFEPAEQLDIEALIAAEKREEVLREALHYPTAFPKIFNPSLSGDAGCFSIDVRDVSYFKIEIRNQKGQLMFNSQDPNFIWKGTTLDGSMAPEGTYLFLVESNDLNGQAIKPQQGAVFLMRK